MEYLEYLADMFCAEVFEITKNSLNAELAELTWLSFAESQVNLVSELAASHSFGEMDQGMKSSKHDLLYICY